MKQLSLLALLTAALLALPGFAERPGPDATLYRGILHGIESVFDRDYSNLDSSGKPTAGVLAEIETFLSVLNGFGISGSTTLDNFLDEHQALCAGPASSTCTETKVEIKASTHSNATLFGTTTSFVYDIVVWQNDGSGFHRFLEGFFSPVVGNPGKGNLTVLTCSNCNTVGHGKIEWDNSAPPYHVRAHLYDVPVGGSGVYGNAIIDAVYTPSTGEQKLSVAATNVCDSSALTATSICPSATSSGTNDHSAGYSAMLHANTTTGNVFVWGYKDVNTGTTTESAGGFTADQMCIKADQTSDVSGSTVCHTDGIDNFTGMTGYAPEDAAALTWGTGQWPMSDVTDTPSF